MDELQTTLNAILSAVSGPVEVRYREHDYGWVDQGMDVDVEMKDGWIEVAGCGMLKSAMLRDAGHDPDQVQGYAFGLGLERLAQVKARAEERPRAMASPLPKASAMTVSGQTPCSFRSHRGVPRGDVV